MMNYILKVNESSSFAKKLIELILIYSKNNKDIILEREISDSTKKSIVEVNTHTGETFQKANRMMNDLLQFE